jgi:hypothetical protein
MGGSARAARFEDIMDFTKTHPKYILIRTWKLKYSLKKMLLLR